MKRIISLFLALVLLIGMLPAGASAATLDNGLAYKVYENHVTITDYTGDAATVVIPARIEGKPVTTISYGAFDDCTNLISVSIPDGVTEIKSTVFENCTNLTSVEIPDSVTAIGYGAFSGCSSLTNIDLPDHITSISGMTFYGCSSLTSIDIPDGVSTIERDAFGLCTSLTNMEIPESVTFMDSDVFIGCSSLASVVLPSSITSIPSRAFCDCTSLTEIDLPDGITSIKSQAFANCASLTSIEIPAGVTSIGWSVFSGCSSLTGIVIPDGISAIERSTFMHCASLTGIELPDSLTFIDEWSFFGCSSLTGIDIPDGVTSIGTYAFAGCSGLTSVELPDSLTSIDEWTFSDCISLTSVDIPDNVTSIGGYAFGNCTNLTSVDLPDSLISIGGSAFQYCTSLTSVVIPDSVTDIGVSAFHYCTSLTDVDIPDSVTSIGASAFAYCSGLTSIEIPDSVTFIGRDAFTYCTELTGIVIPDGVTAIYDSTLYHCTNLTSIVIPDSVTSIGENAFSFCENLTSIEIPDSVASISNTAFDYCESLTGIHVDANNPYYSSDDRGVLFDKDKTLLVRAPGAITGTYTIPDGVTAIDYKAFYACDQLTGVEIPDGVTDIAEFAFSRCTSLSSVNLPIGITYIDCYTFSGCHSLPSIEFPCGVAFIGERAFLSCHNLSKIYFTGDAPEFDGRTIFYDVNATAYYPEGNTTWTAAAKQGYGGYLRWTPYAAPVHTHEYTSTVNAPTCTRFGFTLCTCICGDRYVADQVDALGHDYADGVCNRCGRAESDIEDPTRPSDPSNGLCAPDDVLTRGMMAYVLWNYCGSPEPYFLTRPFTDVSESDYYHDAVYWAAENGIMTGKNLIKFNPDAAVNRAQAATWLWRSLGSPEPHDINPYADVKEDDFYYKAALWTTTVEAFMEPVDYCHFGPMDQCLYSHINWRTTDHFHDFSSAYTPPTCTTEGFTTFTCTLCGYSYTATYGDALGHDYEDGSCTRCGEAAPDHEEPAPPPFDDVPVGSFYYDPVLWAVENGITNGATASSFSPSDKCLRAHVVTFLWRAEGCLEPGSSVSSFDDVKSSDFFFKPVLWAVEKGITNGVSQTRFGAYDVCNRAAVVTFLWRAAGSPEPKSTDNPFTDVKSTDFFCKPVLWAVEQGITNGLSATEFGPNAACNRAQVVTFLYRAYND